MGIANISIYVKKYILTFNKRRDKKGNEVSSKVDADFWSPSSHAMFSSRLLKQ